MIKSEKMAIMSEMNLLKDKKVLILGTANERSIAWYIAEEFYRQGAKIGMSYLNEAMKRRVVPLSEKINADFVFELDVERQESILAMKDCVQNHVGLN